MGWCIWFTNTYLLNERRHSKHFFVLLSVRKVTPSSTTLWGTRSKWAPASPKTSTCLQSKAPPACWARAKSVPAISSDCVSVATTQIQKWSWSSEQSCCKCLFYFLFLLAPPFLFSFLMTVTDLQNIFFGSNESFLPLTQCCCGVFLLVQQTICFVLYLTHQFFIYCKITFRFLITQMSDYLSLWGE